MHVHVSCYYWLSNSTSEVSFFVVVYLDEREASPTKVTVASEKLEKHEGLTDDV